MFWDMHWSILLVSDVIPFCCCLFWVLSLPIKSFFNLSSSKLNLRYSKLLNSEIRASCCIFSSITWSWNWLMNSICYSSCTWFLLMAWVILSKSILMSSSVRLVMSKAYWQNTLNFCVIKRIRWLILICSFVLATVLSSMRNMFSLIYFRKKVE